MKKVVAKLFGVPVDKSLKAHEKTVKMSSKFNDISQMSGIELKEYYASLKGSLSVLEKAKICAIAKRASELTLGMVHYDVQLLAGLALNDGSIAEMKTGEGKTLAATVAVLIKHAEGKLSHIATANEYLSGRDYALLKPFYELLGLKPGLIEPESTPAEKQAIYSESDVIFGSYNEFVFDYLRSNLAKRPSDETNNKQEFLIIDEADFVLIDEARNPVSLTGPVPSDKKTITAMADFPKQIKSKVFDSSGELISARKLFDFDEYDVVYDKEGVSVELTEAGYTTLERFCKSKGLIDAQASGSLYAGENIMLVNAALAALKAHLVIEKDIKYVVEDDKVLPIDPSTGRTTTGMRWHGGINQALEAKEGVSITPDFGVIGQVTLQNYFRQYEVISGMTGTAWSEQAELQEIYGLSVCKIPTNLPLARIDEPDRLFRTRNEKYKAIACLVKQGVSSGRPVLLGTYSVKESEDVSAELNKIGLDHEILNAKNHAREAEIISAAGKSGSITITTNMAGRGTDIVPDTKAVEAGGLMVIGTERGSARRIDDQLKGRAGRQGNPGSSIYFLSLEDELFKVFGNSHLKGLFEQFGVKEGEYLSNKFIDKAIYKAQFELNHQYAQARKQVIRFDDMIAMQRRWMYDLRKGWLHGERDLDEAKSIVLENMRSDLNYYLPVNSMREQWDTDAFEKFAEEKWYLSFKIDEHMWDPKTMDFNPEEIHDSVIRFLESVYDDQSQYLTNDAIKGMASAIMIQTLDTLWVSHLDRLDSMKKGVFLQVHAQKDPFREFARFALAAYEDLIDEVKDLFSKSMKLSLNMNKQRVIEESGKKTA